MSVLPQSNYTLSDPQDGKPNFIAQNVCSLAVLLNKRAYSTPKLQCQFNLPSSQTDIRMSYRSFFMIDLSRSPFWDSDRRAKGLHYLHFLLHGRRVVRDNPTSQQFKKLLFATFTSAGQLSLSSATLVQSTPPSHFFTMQFSISYQRLRLPSSFLPSGFPIKSCTHLPLTPHAI